MPLTPHGAPDRGIPGDISRPVDWGRMLVHSVGGTPRRARGSGRGTQRERPPPKCSQCHYEKDNTGPGCVMRKKPFAWAMYGPGLAKGFWPGFLGALSELSSGHVVPCPL